MQRYCAASSHAEFTLQPAAGAHGELTGVMMIKNILKRKVRSAGLF